MTKSKIVSFEVIECSKLKELNANWDDYGTNYALVKFVDGLAVQLIGSDGGEPEDQSLVRDWSWVSDALMEAYNSGYDDGNYDGWDGKL